VKGILAAGTETDPPPPATGDGGAAAHLHGPSQLFANVVALPTATGLPTPGTTAANAAHPAQAHPDPSDHRPDAHPEPDRPIAPEPAGADSKEAS